MNKKIIAIISFLSVSALHAAVPAVERSKPSTVSGQTQTTTSSDIIPSTVACSADASKELNANFINTITISGELKISPTGACKEVGEKTLCESSVKIQIPPHIDNCLKMSIALMPLRSTATNDAQDFGFKILNNFEYTATNTLVPAGKTFDDLTQQEKYEGCLKKEGALNAKGEWDYTKIKTVSSAVEVSGLKYEGKPITRASILTSKAAGIAIEYGIGDTHPVSDAIDGCYDAQKIALSKNFPTTPAIAAKEKDLLVRQKASELCTAGIPDLGAVAEVEKDFGNDFSSLSGLTKEIVAKMRSIAKEDRFELGDKYLKDLAEMAKDIEKLKDEDEVRDAAADYIETLNKYKSEIEDPLYDQLKALLEQRKNAKTSEEKAKINKDIAEISKFLERFSTGNQKAKVVTDKFLEFGVTIEASMVNDRNVASRLYGALRKSGEEGIKIEEISKKQESASKKFDSVVVQAERVYSARTGGATYSGEYQRQASKWQSKQQQVWSDYQTQQQKYSAACQMQFWGTVKNPAQCRYGMQTQQQRLSQAQAWSGYYGKQYSTASNSYAMFYQLESEARRRAASVNSDSGSGYGYDPYSDTSSAYSFPWLNQYVGSMGVDYSSMSPIGGSMGIIDNSSMIGYGYQMPSLTSGYSQGFSMPMTGGSSGFSFSSSPSGTYMYRY